MTTQHEETALTLAAVLRLMEYMHERPEMFDSTQIIPEWQQVLTSEDLAIVYSPEVDALVDFAIEDIELQLTINALSAFFDEIIRG